MAATTTFNSDLMELIPHANVVQKLSVELCDITKEQALTAIKSFVDSKIKDTIQYINQCIQAEIKSNPMATYVLINTDDIFNSWEPKLSPEELLAYNQYYNILRCDYTLLTFKTCKYDNQFAKTKNDIVKSVLEETFKLYHEQGYRTQLCWIYGCSPYIDCFDIIWKDVK
jgi:hypothetical protein